MKPIALILLLTGATAGGLVLGQAVAPALNGGKGGGTVDKQAATPAAAAVATKPALAAAATNPTTTPATTSYRDITWDDLTPKDWDPMKQFKSMNFGVLSDADPKAVAMLKQMRETWDNAPTNNAIDGQTVRIAGYLVPLDETPAGLKQFLLVPYFGACIHTPPPPSNQIIDVTPAKPAKDLRAMDAVWVSGTVKALRSDTYMGASSYRMDAMKIEPYVQPKAN